MRRTSQANAAGVNLRLMPDGMGRQRVNTSFAQLAAPPPPPAAAPATARAAALPAADPSADSAPGVAASPPRAAPSLSVAEAPMELHWRLEWSFPLGRPALTATSESVRDDAALSSLLHGFLNPAPVPGPYLPSYLACMAFVCACCVCVLCVRAVCARAVCACGVRAVCARVCRESRRAAFVSSCLRFRGSA